MMLVPCALPLGNGMFNILPPAAPLTMKQSCACVVFLVLPFFARSTRTAQLQIFTYDQNINKAVRYFYLAMAWFLLPPPHPPSGEAIVRVRGAFVLLLS